MGPRYRLERPIARARILRNSATDAERRLWTRLRGRRLDGLKFSRQMPVAGYFCDFVCRSHRLVVELDGSQHASAADYDDRRTGRLKEAGYRVIRFWNNDLTQNMEGVLEAIASAAREESGGPPPGPLPPAGGGGT